MWKRPEKCIMNADCVRFVKETEHAISIQNSYSGIVWKSIFTHLSI